MPHVGGAPAGWRQTPVSSRRLTASRALEYAIQIVYAACCWCVILTRKGERRGGGIGSFLDAMAAISYGFMVFLVWAIFRASRRSEIGEGSDL